MFDPEQVGQWSDVVVAGFVIGLLVFLFAGFLFVREHRKHQRNRSRQRARDVAAIEELAREQGGETSMRLLARKYRGLIERSGLKGWRIFGDK